MFLCLFIAKCFCIESRARCCLICFLGSTLPLFLIHHSTRSRLLHVWRAYWSQKTETHRLRFCRCVSSTRVNKQGLRCCGCCGNWFSQQDWIKELRVRSVCCNGLFLDEICKWWGHAQGCDKHFASQWIPNILLSYIIYAVFSDLLYSIKKYAYFILILRKQAVTFSEMLWLVCCDWQIQPYIHRFFYNK